MAKAQKALSHTLKLGLWIGTTLAMGPAAIAQPVGPPVDETLTPYVSTADSVLSLIHI